MTMQNKERLTAIVFPWYYGTKVTNFGSPLLWFGHLNTFVYPFISPLPIETFDELCKRATERKSPLYPVFAAAAHYCFKKTNESVSSFLQESGGLEGRITRIAGVGPGGQDHYAEIRKNFAPAVAS